MPFGPWNDFDDCVNSMMDEQDYDEETAERVCGSLEQRLKEEDSEEFEKLLQDEMESEEGNVEALLNSIQDASSVISDGMLEMVSAVGNPAQPSDWIMLKSENDNYDWKSSGPLVLKKDEDERKGYAPALVPNEVDKDGDVVPATVIKRMAHNFMKEDGTIDEEHNLIDDKGEVVESWLLKEDRTFDLPNGEEKTYPKGTWMLGIEFVKETWEKIKSGELQGLSIYGKSQHIELKSNNLECPHCGEKVKSTKREDRQVQFVKPLSEKDNSKDDNMSDESLEEIKETLSELNDSIETLSEGFSEVKDELSEPEEPEFEEKQEIEDLTDAIDWLEDNAPEEIAAMIQDAVQSSTDEEDEDKDDSEESPEEPETPEKEENPDGAEEKSAKIKKGNEEETRKAQIDVDSEKKISFKESLLGGE